MKYKRIFVIITDSLGVGAAEDAHIYGDVGTNTLKHLSYSKKNFKIPNLEKMGIGHITDVNNTKPVTNPIASYGSMKEISVGKDTLTGHWELMGLEVTSPFPSFEKNGFPQELIGKLEKESGRKVIGNITASGTEIIKDMGEEHMRTGAIIVYTSTDSVLQIAAHESIVPLDELYKICEIARRLTLENRDWLVGRVIARPFIGDNSSNFVRTSNRHDYAVKPYGTTILDSLKENNHDVIAIGKINDIYDGEGITKFFKTKSNHHGMELTIETAKSDFNGICFVNLVDFDAIYGHRRNAIGYAESLEEFDNDLGNLLPLIKDDDLLIISADHGNDPIHIGTDHTREHVLLLVYNRLLKAQNLGLRETFADVGASIAKNFNVKAPVIGKSFL